MKMVPKCHAKNCMHCPSTPPNCLYDLLDPSLINRMHVAHFQYEQNPNHLPKVITLDRADSKFKDNYVRHHTHPLIEYFKRIPKGTKVDTTSLAPWYPPESQPTFPPYPPLGNTLQLPPSPQPQILFERSNPILPTFLDEATSSVTALQARSYQSPSSTSFPGFSALRQMRQHNREQSDLYQLGRHQQEEYESQRETSRNQPKRAPSKRPPLKELQFPDEL